MKFNIKALAIAASATMIVRDAAGDAQLDAAGNKLSITFCSPGTKQYQKAAHARDERNNTRVFGRMQGKSEAKQSAEDKVTERAEFLAGVTISFDGFDDGEDGGYEMFKRIYSNLELGHIADDSEKFLGDRGNFKKSSATSSQATSATQPG